MPTLPIDWDMVRIRYEGGQTPYRISKDLGGRPTKQGIMKRAQREGWQQRPNGPMAVAESLPIVIRAQSLTGPTKCTPERVAFILELIARGSSVKLACAAAGINEKTLKNWQADDPQLAEAIRQTRAGKIADWIASIDTAAQRDWKAAKELLAAAPEATDFNPAQSGGVTVVLNIDRDSLKGTTVDHDPS